MLLLDNCNWMHLIATHTCFGVLVTISFVFICRSLLTCGPSTAANLSERGVPTPEHQNANDLPKAQGLPQVSQQATKNMIYVPAASHRLARTTLAGGPSLPPPVSIVPTLLDR
jgi:hypothetical protein